MCLMLLYQRCAVGKVELPENVLDVKFDGVFDNVDCCSLIGLAELRFKQGVFLLIIHGMNDNHSQRG